MESLKQYFEDQRKDNEILKQEIISKLENLFSPLHIPPSSSNRSPTKYCNYISELCHFEQKINHKLTEINFELRRFILQNKFPALEPPPLKTEELDNSFDDIETLKANSSRLISKIDKLLDKQTQDTETNLISKHVLEDDEKICLKNAHQASYQQEGPLVYLNSNSKAKPGEKVKRESTFFELDDIDKRSLLCKENHEIEKCHNGNDTHSYREPKIVSALHTSSNEECEVDHSKFKTFKEISVPNFNIFKEEQNSMVESIGTKSHLVEAGQSNKMVNTSFDTKDSISDIIQKNLIELSSSKPANSRHNSNTEIDDIFSPPQQKKGQSLGNLLSEINSKIDNDIIDLPYRNKVKSENDSYDEVDIQFQEDIFNLFHQNRVQSKDYSFQGVDIEIKKDIFNFSDRNGEQSKDCNNVGFKINDDIFSLSHQNRIKSEDNSSNGVDTKIDDNLFNSHDQDGNEPQISFCEKIETDLKKQFQGLVPDSDVSSCYDSESDSGSNPSEELLEGIPKYKLENNVNLCDSSKADYLKEVHNTNCPVEELKKEYVQDTNDLQASLRNDVDKEKGTKKEDISSEQEKSSGASAYVSVAPQSENVKPVFSAEEKIKKLGLEDRRTIFEKTKKTAVLPDLRLRPSEPSVTDTEKLKHIQNRNSKFEIPNNTVPAVNACCVFSHVESPSEFYIHPDNEESKLIDNLNDLITEYYKKTKTPYCSKYEAFENIGRYCCAFVKEDKMYYRAEVVDWLFDETEKLVLIKLVDYGNSLYAHFKHLRVLTEIFCGLPKLAIRCYLPLLYPPGSTKSGLLTEWPAESTEAFFELACLSVQNSNALFKIVFVEEENNSRDGAGIDLYQVNGPDRNTIGQLLIDLGHAVQLVLWEDDPMGILSDEEDIKNLEGCDNINEVILGYDPRDEARICKFTKPDGGRCFKRSCKLEHTKFTRGGFTTDQALTYAEALSDLTLPKPNEFTAIRFTTFVSATYYYVNIVRFVPNLNELEYIINNPVNYSTFEKYKILPAHGEIVLVKHWQKRWLRGKVRHHHFSEDGKCARVQIFMVDYGDIIDVTLDDIRKIKAEYLNLPFQAIECVLQNYKGSGEFGQKDMDRFFYENMIFRRFAAKVVAVSDMHMCTEIYFKNRNLGDILVDYGFLTKVKNKMIFPHPKSVIIPG